MNRNIIKIIAFISMIIDHIGRVLFPNIIIFEIIGRLAFPLFGFFIAEGYYHTRNKGRYALTLLIFAALSWVPFNLALGFPMWKVNIIGVFLISILGMYIIDKMKGNTNLSVTFIAVFCIYVLGCLIFDLFALAPEGIYGIMLPIIFYVSRSKKTLQLVLSGVFLLVMSLLMIVGGAVQTGLIQLTSLLSLILIGVYNGKKGNANLKYLFYVGYPLHFVVLWLISIIL